MDERNIGKLAHFMGVSPYTIKYYEKIGLLHSSRDKNSNYRRYELRTCTDILECMKYRGMGFSLKELEALVKTADSETQNRMIQERLRAVEEELERLNDLHQFLTEYMREIKHLDRGLNQWYVMPLEGVTYCRMQTEGLNFTENNIGDDSVNIMNYAPRTMSMVLLKQSYLNGGPQAFSWGQSVTFPQEQAELEGRPEFIRLTADRAFVAYRKYTGPYVANGELAEDLRSMFLAYASEIPGDVYAFRLKVVHDGQGNDWNYFKIVVPLRG